MVLIRLPRKSLAAERSVQITIPIGAYTECQAEPICGLVSASGIIGLLDDPASFYEPARLEAQLLWFRMVKIRYE
jgi:predicted transcriptional regulator